MKVVACGSRPRFSSVSSLHCGLKGFKKIIIIRKVHCTFLFKINPAPCPGVVQSLSHTCLSVAGRLQHVLLFSVVARSLLSLMSIESVMPPPSPFAFILS